jgi:hypothetical protein
VKKFLLSKDQINNLGLIALKKIDFLVERRGQLSLGDYREEWEKLSDEVEELVLFDQLVNLDPEGEIEAK